MLDLLARCGPIWAIAIDHLYDLRASLVSIGGMMAAGVAAVENTDDEVDPYEAQISADGTLTLPLHGVMVASVPAWLKGWGLNICDLAELRAWVQRAAADDRVKAITLDINSPGGSVAGTDELASALSASGKPITAHATGMCASAAYWIASTADRIVATRLTIVGSIGVYAVLTDYSAADKAFGIERVLVSSGPAKGMGADGKVTPALVKSVQARIDATAEIFADQVGTARELSGKALAAVTTGEDWLAKDAKALGLIDALTTDDETEEDPADDDKADDDADDDKKDDDKATLTPAPAAAVAAITAAQALALVAAHPDAAAFITERIEAGDTFVMLNEALTARQTNAIAAENAALVQRLAALQTEQADTKKKLDALAALGQPSDPGHAQAPSTAPRKTLDEINAMTPYQRASFFSAGGQIVEAAATTP